MPAQLALFRESPRPRAVPAPGWGGPRGRIQIEFKRGAVVVRRVHTQEAWGREAVDRWVEWAKGQQGNWESFEVQESAAGVAE